MALMNIKSQPCREILETCLMLVSCLFIASLLLNLSRADEGIEFFESRIRPILVEHCYKCHSAESEVIESSIRNYETAAQMQTLVPALCDVSSETAETHQLYGTDRGNDFDKFYALQCLRARRLVESGYR